MTTDVTWTEKPAANGANKRSIGTLATGVVVCENEYDDRDLLVKQTKWSPAGLLQEVTHYKDGLKHGLVTRYSSDGHLLSKIHYENDQIHGLCERFYESQDRETIKERAFYKNGQREGEFTEFFKNGQIEESGTVLNGKYEGSRFRFFESGRLRDHIRYVGGQMHGDMEEFYENGVLKRRLPHRNGKRHGVESHFNDKGQMTSRSCWISGESSNDFTAFTTSEDGVENGETVEFFDSSGKPRSRHTYKNGVLDGPYEVFFASGTVRESGLYLQRKQNGPVHYFNEENGKCIQTTCYKEGRRDGPHTVFDTVGEIQRIENYIDGIFQSSRTYDSKGNLQGSIEFETDGRGIMRRYAPNGHLVRETEVRANASRNRAIFHGFDRIYSPSGLVSEAFYQSNLPDGPFRCFRDNGILERIEEFERGYRTKAALANAKGEIYRIITYTHDGLILSEEKIEGVAPGPNEPESADETSIKKGSKIDGYEIIRSIGHGGMGDVFLAEEKNLDRRVSIKMIRGEADAETLARFQSEARALARITHQNVVKVYVIGEHRGLPYMAMEFVEGWPLSALLGQGLLGFDEQMSLFRQIVSGMRAAHEATVLHRDLKPANVVVSKNFDVKIIDFGISKILVEDKGLTAPNTALGTIRYMSPEMAMGQPATIQTDIYSMGIILFEMLTGETPFRGANRLETLELIKTAPVVFPEGIATILPEALKALVIRMTSKQINDRHGSMAEVLKALEEISFDHLPAEFRAPMQKGLEIANLEEARKILKEKGHSSSELSLILNLACRIQQNMVADLDKTQPLHAVEDFVLSPEALDQATARYELAKKGLS